MRKKPVHLVTFFDANYLPKALVTYQSLLDQFSNFILYAFCFDDIAYETIQSLNLSNVVAVPYQKFKSKELAASKAKKQKFYEYYWSYKPYLIGTVMKETKAETVTYIDCDFRFFDSPAVIFEQIEGADVLIQPNNFSAAEMAQYMPVGYYCSCFVSFRNSVQGRKVMRWWHHRCVEWCFATFENGKFADQKYLDDWRKRFKGIREIITIGANIAPWNLQKYDVSQRGSAVLVNNEPLIYYHYHSFRMNLDNYRYLITGDRENYYEISKDAIRLIYKPYITDLRRVIKYLKHFQGYHAYTQVNPQSRIHLINEKEPATFSSYKKHTKR